MYDYLSEDRHPFDELRVMKSIESNHDWTPDKNIRGVTISPGFPMGAFGNDRLLEVSK